MAIDEKVKKLLNAFRAELKPGAPIEHVRADLDRVMETFPAAYKKDMSEKYPNKIDDSNIRDAFNAASKVYINALYNSLGKPEPLVDGPEWYGTLITDWAGKVSREHQGQIESAIKNKDSAKVLDLMNEAYKAQASKLPHVIAKIQGQPTEVQLPLFTESLKPIGGKNVAKAIANPGALAQVLAGNYAGQEAYK